MKTEEVLQLVKAHFGEGCYRVCKERKKQIDKYGFTGKHHANHPEWYDRGQLLSAAIMLCSDDQEMINCYENLTPTNWNKEWWLDMLSRPFKERIEISGSLMAAEWDRQKGLGNF